MAQWHDYGEVQGLQANVDPKFSFCRDEHGNMVAVFLDVQGKGYYLYSEFRTPQWSQGRIDGVSLTDMQLEVHNGMAQLALVTWKDSVPNKVPHFGILELEKIY